MEHINITFPEELKRKLDRAAKSEHTKRSTLIQKAVRVYLQLRKKKRRDLLLRKGYREMRDELMKTMEDFRSLDDGSLNEID